MFRAILAEQASIRTCLVEVRTITVSNKQMTLSVFRQLEELPLIFESIRWCGGGGRGDTETHWENSLPGSDNVWGWVNYHTGCAVEDFDGHLHMVVERGGRLYKVQIAYNDLSSPEERGPDYRRAIEAGQLFIAV